MGLLFFCGQTALSLASEKPQRIVSLSLCTDQVLLMLVEPERVQAVSFLAHDPIYSVMVEQAQGIPSHGGLAEEIVPLQPDLIIGSRYSTGQAQSILQRLGHPVTAFDSPENFQQVADFTRAVGQAVGEPERAEAVIATMQREIAQAKASVAHLPEQLAISYGPNGYTAGKNTLKNEILNAVGFRNLAAELGIEFYGNLSIEQLLIAKPDAVIIDEAIPNQDSLAQDYINHPALKKLYHGQRMPSVPTRYWLCPGPTVAKAVSALAEQRL
jgi:iron complex transport system substrate-binding protein